MRFTFQFQALVFLCLVTAARAANLPSGIRPVGFVARAALTEAELSVQQKVQFALPLRNYDEMCARVMHGEVIPARELIARYCPTQDAWSEVAQWAKENGLEVAPEEATHLAVVAHAPLATIQRALRVNFARIVGTDGTNTRRHSIGHPLPRSCAVACRWSSGCRHTSAADARRRRFRWATFRTSGPRPSGSFMAPMIPEWMGRGKRS
jgi:hypothetical protein